ncbi:MAG: helix-turn-helix transcriptional regulator [Deltaproteobacteria bacterium]|nr:helix-turn-helix transcriptional regulator [Deltaproteobacteria bacterium]
MVIKNQDICQVKCINPGKIARTRRAMASEADCAGLAGIFKVLGDVTRVRMLQALSIQELCVCDLAAALDLNQSAVSHQLRLLRSARLVKYRKDGKVVYYSLDDDHVKTLFDQGLEHVQGG